MSKLRKYRVIEQKLEQMPGPDVGGLWADMCSRLDQHMPEEKEERRMLWWWRNSGIFLMVPVAIFVSAIIFTLIILNDKNKDASTAVDAASGNVVMVHTDDIPDELPTSDQVGANTGNNRQVPPAPSEGQSNAAVTRRVAALRTGHKMHSASTNEMVAVQTTTGVASTGPVNFRKVSRIVVSSASRGNAIVLASPNAGTAQSYFPAQQIIRQGRVRQPVPELTADAIMPVQKPAYPELTLSTSLTAAPVLLKQKQLLPGITDTMNFPSGALLYSKAASAKKFVVGGALNINMPVSRQEMSTVSLNGGKNKLVDYLPSVYVQYHFAPRFFVQSEFQAITPQHTPKLTLSSTTTELSATRKQVHSVQLTKFYYMNLPVSLHYRVLPNLYAGAGIQYSYLTRSMLTEENSIWQNGNNGWEQKTSNAKLHVMKNPTKEKEKFKTNNNPNNPAPNAPTPVDVVAQQFKSNDWRFTYDLNYYRRRFNAGMRMNIGINNYIDTEVSGTNVPVKDRNKSFHLYIRYNIWERKRS